MPFSPEDVTLGAELAGIHLLRHGGRDHRRRLGADEAFARLRREVVWPTFDVSPSRWWAELFAQLGDGCLDINDHLRDTLADLGSWQVPPVATLEQLRAAGREPARRLVAESRAPVAESRSRSPGLCPA